MSNWYSNRHRQVKSTPATSDTLLDLAGKHTRKKPPLQKWQAFSTIYHRPEDSPLRPVVEALFNRRNDPAAVGYLSDYLPPGADISTVSRFLFHSAYFRERCTRLSSDEEAEVEAYIQEHSRRAETQREQPWFLDDEYEDKPLLAENRFIQQ